jgi:uncharacterized protein YlaI
MLRTAYPSVVADRDILVYFVNSEYAPVPRDDLSVVRVLCPKLQLMSEQNLHRMIDISIRMVVCVTCHSSSSWRTYSQIQKGHFSGFASKDGPR